MNRKISSLAKLAPAVLLMLGTHAEPAIAAVAPGRYVITNGGTSTGTVFDTVTQLTWEQSFTTNTSIASAPSICAALNTSGLGGFSTGWRMPLVKELVSIVDYESATSPMIDTAAFPQTPVADVLSSTATPSIIGDESVGGDVYSVSFATGAVTFDSAAVVRCVH